MALDRKALQPRLMEAKAFLAIGDKAAAKTALAEIVETIAPEDVTLYEGKNYDPYSLRELATDLLFKHFPKEAAGLVRAPLDPNHAERFDSAKQLAKLGGAATKALLIKSLGAPLEKGASFGDMSAAAYVKKMMALLKPMKLTVDDLGRIRSFFADDPTLLAAVGGKVPPKTGNAAVPEKAAASKKLRKFLESVFDEFEVQIRKEIGPQKKGPVRSESIENVLTNFVGDAIEDETGFGLEQDVFDVFEKLVDERLKAKRK